MVVVMSEFGRRLKENGGIGHRPRTRRSHAALGRARTEVAKFTANGPVWPMRQLVGPGDLAVTTDYRDVLAEIIQQRLNNPHLATIFQAIRRDLEG